MADRSWSSMLADIRARGWMVAVHNDYRLGGELHTFWLFTMDSRAVKGEGRTDGEALTKVLQQIEGPAPTATTPAACQIDGYSSRVCQLGTKSCTVEHPSVVAAPSSAQVDAMARRFLRWRLPDSFNPDGGISFEKIGGQSGPYPFQREPVGTNLFTIEQARAMVLHMLDLPIEERGT